MTAWLYYRLGAEEYWRTSAAAAPGRQVEFLSPWHDWRQSVLPTAADFHADVDAGGAVATPVSEEEALQAAAKRKAQEAELEAARRARES